LVNNFLTVVGYSTNLQVMEALLERRLRFESIPEGLLLETRRMRGQRRPVVVVVAREVETLQTLSKKTKLT